MTPSNSSPFESRPASGSGSGKNAQGASTSGSGSKTGSSGPTGSSAKSSPQQGSGQPGAKPAARPGTPVGSRPQSAAAKAGPSATRPAVRPETAAKGGAASGLVKPAPKAKARRAKLLVSKVDPWSVLKMSFLLSVALGIVTVIAAVVLWTVLDLTGIFNKVNELLGEVVGSEGGGFDLRKVASLGQVVSFSTIIAVVNVGLLTALSTLSAVLYNVAASLVGGIGVTLTDD